jgi:hypothetical protein
VLSKIIVPSCRRIHKSKLIFHKTATRASHELQLDDSKLPSLSTLTERKGALKIDYVKLKNRRTTSESSSETGIAF